MTARSVPSDLVPQGSSLESDRRARGTLQPLYAGGQENMEKTPLARHDLLPTGYQLGAIQTMRGCPLNCSFCSVSTFNGRTYRHRAVDAVVAEFRMADDEELLRLARRAGAPASSSVSNRPAKRA